MSTPPLLRLPNFSIPFVLETDACSSGLGAVLMQEGRPIAFYSQSLGPKMSAQSVYEKEALAILHALKKWRHYFLGNKVTIKTDQQALKYLGSQRLLEGIQHKLMLKLLEFDYNIEYKKGKENAVADALSRKFEDDDHGDNILPNQASSSCSQLSMSVPTWLSEVQDSYAEDSHCRKLLEELTIKPTSHKDFTLQTGILRFKGKVYIGSSTTLRDKVFETYHSSLFGGHSGTKVTLHRLKQVFFWPHLRQYVNDKVAACPICQISKTEKLPYPGLLQPLPIPTQKWTEISLDFVEGLPKSKGKEVILVVVDRLTKYAHFIPLALISLWQTLSNCMALLLPLSVTEMLFLQANYGRICSPTSISSSIIAQHTIWSLTARQKGLISVWSSTYGAWRFNNPKSGVTGYPPQNGGTTVLSIPPSK
jgi:hypothetical protein